jgi:hypothetical protein
MRRTTKKRRLTQDNTILITTEENMLSTKIAKTTEPIGARMDIIDAMLDRKKWDKKELATEKKELYHLRHLAKNYQDSTQATIFLKSEFREAYSQFMSETHLFTACIVNIQKDTLMELETYKDVERWYEKAYQVVERIDYISAVQKDRDTEEYGI